MIIIDNCKAYNIIKSYNNTLPVQNYNDSVYDGQYGILNPLLVQYYQGLHREYKSPKYQLKIQLRRECNSELG